MASLRLRVTFQYEADLAGGALGTYASELLPSLHVFLTHGLGVTSADTPDDGVRVLSPSALAAKTAGPPSVTVELPFNPAGPTIPPVQGEEGWHLPGSRFLAQSKEPRGTAWDVPADASVSFNAYAETATQHGQLCRTRAGEALFLLSELLDTTGKEGWTRDKGNVRAEWQVTGDEPLVKGFVNITDVQLLVGTPSKSFKVVPSEAIAFDEKAVAVFHGDDKNKVKAEAAFQTVEWLEERVDASLNLFFPQGRTPLGRSVPSYMRRMHCPYFNTSAGMIWGSAYALPRPRAPAQAGYFATVLRAALLRADASAEDLMHAVRAQEQDHSKFLPSTAAVLRVYGDMFSVYANSLVYLDDFTNEGGRTYLARPDSSHPGPDSGKRSHVSRMRLVRRSDLLAPSGNAPGEAEKVRANPVEVSEDYKTARLGHGDDCEGVAKESYTQFWDFRRSQISGEKSFLESEEEFALLEHFHRLSNANVFTPMLVLGAVTNKKLDANVGRDMTDDDAMAHTYLALVPTGRLLEHLCDAAPDVPYQGLTEAIRSSKYATEYVKAGWHQDAHVLICEGTARSSSLVLPPTTYYETLAEKQAVARSAVRRFNAQVTLLKDIPDATVQMEIPSRRIDDESHDIREDRVDASDFYKGNSSAYVSAFRETGILDLAFAWQEGDALTHGIRFNRFLGSRWHPSVRLVPYNRLGPKEGAIVETVLGQLEPVPTLRRTPPSPLPASGIEIPASLIGRTKEPRSTRSLLRNSSAMPPPPENIVLSIRDEDLSPQLCKKVSTVLERHKGLFTSAAITTHYLSDAPVRGDETTLPPVIIHDISLRLRDDDD